MIDGKIVTVKLQKSKNIINYLCPVFQFFWSHMLWGKVVIYLLIIIFSSFKAGQSTQLEGEREYEIGYMAYLNVQKWIQLENVGIHLTLHFENHCLDEFKAW